jgi:hypothetical protein
MNNDCAGHIVSSDFARRTPVRDDENTAGRSADEAAERDLDRS